MSALEIHDQAGWKRFLPFLTWMSRYRSEDLTSDLLAGVIVAIMLVPQGMAYAMLAGLPPQVGLYASIVPTLLYGLLGTSRTLAVGPVALTSILVAASVGKLASQGEQNYLLIAIALALLVGMMQLMMGLLRMGSVVNFISHPVLSEFTSAAAILIALSQLKSLAGLPMERVEGFVATLWETYRNLAAVNWPSLAIGVAGVLILVYFKTGLEQHLKRLKIGSAWRVPIAKSGPLVVVVLGTVLVWGLELNRGAGVQVVGQIPSGLPPLTLPAFDPGSWRALGSAAVTISVIAFLESISVAKALASRRREKVDPNQELVALGFANLGAAFTGAYPVAGGFARSVVNFSVGARTGLASIITAGLISLTLIFMMPLFFFLPKAILAAIILVAVVNLVDLAGLRRVWRYSKTDAASLMVTFAAVLVLGIEGGILAGVITALAVHLWRTSQPHVAMLGRVGDSEHYRNVLRHEVEICPRTLAVRIDESLYFANTQFLENWLLNTIAERPELEKMVLVLSAVNFIDASALESLENLVSELDVAGVTLYLAEVKGPVMDRLTGTGLIKKIGQDHVFLSTHQVMQSLGCV
jgi:SulP family sulfate permease